MRNTIKLRAGAYYFLCCVCFAIHQSADSRASVVQMVQAATTFQKADCTRARLNVGVAKIVMNLRIVIAGGHM